MAAEQMREGTRVYSVLFAKASSRVHKKGMLDGRLIVKPDGRSMMRFELLEILDDGVDQKVFDELVSTIYYTWETVDALFKPNYTFCFANYDIKVLEEEEEENEENSADVAEFTHQCGPPSSQVSNGEATTTTEYKYQPENERI